MKYKRLLPVVLTFFVICNSYATDLKPIKILPPYALEIYNSTFITVPNGATGEPMCAVILNDSILSAESFDVAFIVIENESGDTVFTDVATGVNLPPYTTTKIYSDSWLPAVVTDYSFYVTVSYDYDVVPDNNSLFANIYSMFPASAASKKANKWFSDYQENLKNRSEDTELRAYVNPTPITPENTIIEGDSINTYSVEGISYMAYASLNISDKYEQLGLLMLIDATDTSIVQVDSVSYYVSVDLVPYLADAWTKIDSGHHQVYGPPATVDSITEFNTVQEEVTEPVRDSACALIVSGKIREEWERSSFTQDLDFVEGNLMRELYGPQLSQDQIVRIGNATKTEILDALNQMKDKCDKIYFYYTGHGWEGGMTTNDNGVDQLFYLDLADALYATNAKELCVVIDACFSGSAEGRFRLVSGFEDQNITLITSSMSTKTSLTSTVHTSASGERYNPGFFTWNFMKCFGDPRADTDGDGKTSMAESYHWLMQENPKTSSGKSIARVQNPQLIVNRAVKPGPTQTRIHVPEVNVDLEFEEPLDEGASIHIEEHSGVVDSTTTGDSIYFMSTERYYNINLKNQFSGFRVDIQFTYDYDIDYLDSAGVGDIGLVKRDSVGFDWGKIETEHYPDSNKVVAKGQTGFSDFAFARIIPSVADTSENTDTTTVSVFDFKDSNDNALNATVYPNPAKDKFTLEYNLQQPAIVDIQMMDLAGKIVYKKDVFGTKGENRIRLDNSIYGKLSPGNYILRIYDQSNTSLLKLVIQ